MAAACISSAARATVYRTDSGRQEGHSIKTDAMWVRGLSLKRVQRYHPGSGCIINC